MKKEPKLPDSIVTCINKRDGTLMKVGTASRMIGPAIVDPLHLMLGAGCDDFGVCIYLTLADAAKLKVELARLIADQTQRA
jgi:energy-converting hydrogenase Eha subunit E